MVPTVDDSNVAARVSWSPSTEVDMKYRSNGDAATEETLQAVPSDPRRSEPFGDEMHSEIKYRTMHWWQAGMIMVAETISLGILSLPSALAAVGFVPGIILILGLGVIASYTGYTLGQIKLAYPHIHNMADAGEVLGGPILREIFGASQIIFYIFVMSSHILTFSITMNVLTNHGACKILFGLIGTIVCIIATLPRTLKRVSLLAIVSWMSIFAAVLVTMIGIAINTPSTGKTSSVVPNNLYNGFLAVTNIIFAYAGHVTFFTFISELHTPSDYPKSLLLLQTTDITMYLLTAVIIYLYTAPTTASPSLSTLPPDLRKVAYALALPTITVSGVINAHVAAKSVLIRYSRLNSRHEPSGSSRSILHQNSWSAWGGWVALVAVLWIVAWIVAEGVPGFNQLLGLISALFCSWFTYALSGVFWLFLNRGRWGEGWQKVVLTAVNGGIVVVGAMICGLGLCVWDGNPCRFGGRGVYVCRYFAPLMMEMGVMAISFAFFER